MIPEGTCIGMWVLWVGWKVRGFGNTPETVKKSLQTLENENAVGSEGNIDDDSKQGEGCVRAA